MKTVRMKNGVVIRVTNENASKMVDEGEGMYCAKSEWKKLVRKPQEQDKK